EAGHSAKGGALIGLELLIIDEQAAAGKHSEDDGTISIDQVPHSRARDRDMMKRIVNATATMGEIVIDTLAENIVRKGTVRETLWMIVIITKVETVAGRGLSIEKERRGTGQGHALARAAALNNSGGQQDGWRLQESCLRYHHNA
ncbi:unnamed protein product, partial [Brassica rapa subsp. trilocularis]